MVAITVAHTMRNVESSIVTSEPRVRIAVREDGMDNLVRESKNCNDVESLPKGSVQVDSNKRPPLYTSTPVFRRIAIVSQHYSGFTIKS